MELSQIDFAKCEKALYSQYIKDYIRSSVNDLGYDLVGDVQVSNMNIGPTLRLDAPDWVRENMTPQENLDYRSEYAVSIGDEIRFDNLGIGNKHPPMDLSEPNSYHLTLGKVYRVVDIDTGNKFGRYSKVYIHDDIGRLVPHIRGRFTKMNFSSIEEPEDDDLV